MGVSRPHGRPETRREQAERSPGTIQKSRSGAGQFFLERGATGGDATGRRARAGPRPECRRPSGRFSRRARLNRTATAADSLHEGKTSCSNAIRRRHGA